MMLKIAFRNIFRHKRRSILTALSMVGGFVLSAFFIGWSDGSYKGIIDAFTRSRTGHIQVHQGDYLDRPSLHKTIVHLPELDIIFKETPGIDSWSPRLYCPALVSVGEKSAGAKIIGIDPVKENRTTLFNDKIIAGTALHPGALKETIIGKGLAKLLKAKIGDDAVILSQAADGSIANDKYKIIGIMDSGDEIGDRMAFYLPIDAARELLVMQGRCHEIAITVNNLDRVLPVSKSLEKKISALEPGLAVEPWQVFAKAFYIAMKADEKGMWVSLIIIIFVVAVGVLNTVLMSVLERRREYGVLKAVGTKATQIVKMVLSEMSILSLFSILIGIALGLLVNYYITVHGYTLPEPLTYGGMTFQTLKGEINARSFYIPAVTIFMAAVLVSIFPAIKAARTDPAKSMRTH
ncbi:MAG TPA: FtsX-like permease family protein [Candidatus Deferrimicrobium sp.]|nr:FtsX-like permease family protein [Candidatus Deferrimicrobium sp.]